MTNSLSFSKEELERLKSRDMVRLRLLVEPRVVRCWRCACGDASDSAALGVEDGSELTRAAGGADDCEISKGAFGTEVGGFCAVCALCSAW